MKALVAFLLVFASVTAYAGDCQRPFPILGFSGQEIHFQVTGGGRRTSSIVGLHSESKLVRTVATRQDGTFTVGGLTEGKYWISIDGRKSASFEVRPLTDVVSPQLGNRTHLLETPGPKTATVNGHQVDSLLLMGLMGLRRIAFFSHRFAAQLDAMSSVGQNGPRCRPRWWDPVGSPIRS
jgi:hypothetical protein